MDTHDIIGRQVGILTVDSYDGSEKRINGRRSVERHFYLCSCECGGTIRVIRGNLVSEHTGSCGCLKARKQNNSKGWTGHGDVSGRVWNRVLRKAKERDLKVQVTISEVWKKFQDQDGRCALTGWHISLKSIKGRYSEQTASLDRIDSSRGYTLDNVQWIHKDVNWMKNRFSEDRFLEVCKAVVKHAG